MTIYYVKNLKFGWKLFNLNKIVSEIYLNNYKENVELENIKSYYNFNDKNLDYKAKQVLLSNQYIYSNLKKKKWTFIDFIDNKEYDVFNIIMLSPRIIIYFFNINNPCFLIQNYCYMSFFYFGRVKQKNIIQLFLSSLGNELDIQIIEEHLNFIYNIGINSKSIDFNKKMYFFGMISNVGHHLWNEVSGLIHFIDNKKNIELIDGVVIGPFDFFNIEKYLNDTYNIKTVKFNVNNYPICLNIYPVSMNSIILDNKCETIIKKILNYTPIPQKIINLKKKQFVFDIRTFSRVILNISEVYSYIIHEIYNLLLEKKYILNIVFTGRFLTNLNDINISTDKEIIAQNKIANEIIKNCKDMNIIFDNLIGKSFNNIINYISEAELMIITFGTSAPNLVNWIHNTKIIAFIQSSNFHVFKNIQYDVLQKKNCLFVPYNCFKTNNNKDIIINSKLFYNFLYDVFLKFV